MQFQKFLTFEIASVIDSLLVQADDSKKIIETIQSLNQNAEHVKQFSNEMIVAANAVMQEMSELTKLSEKISNSMNEMAAGTEQITQAANSVSKLTIENKESIEVLGAELNKFVI